jgi:hypothetical protein
MKKIKEKKSITIVIDSRIYDAIENLFGNKSKYINWLIYQDLLKNTNDEELKKMLM